MKRICLACMDRGCKHAISKLTPREEDILRRLLEMPPPTHKELAYAMAIAEGTVRSHLSGLFRKMGFFGAGSTIQAVLWAHQHQNLLRPVGYVVPSVREMVQLKPPKDWKDLPGPGGVAPDSA